MSGERKCIVSPNFHHYKYCPRCGRDDPKETWRFLFCSENCRELYRVFEEYSGGKIDAVTAEARLDKLNVPAVSQLQKSLSDNLKEIRLKAAAAHKAVAEAVLKKGIEEEVRKRKAEANEADADMKVSDDSGFKENEKGTEKFTSETKPKRKPRRKKTADPK